MYSHSCDTTIHVSIKQMHNTTLLQYETLAARVVQVSYRIHKMHSTTRIIIQM